MADSGKKCAFHSRHRCHFREGENPGTVLLPTGVLEADPPVVIRCTFQPIKDLIRS